MPARKYGGAVHLAGYRRPVVSAAPGDVLRDVDVDRTRRFTSWRRRATGSGHAKAKLRSDVCRYHFVNARAPAARPSSRLGFSGMGLVTTEPAYSRVLQHRTARYYAPNAYEEGTDVPRYLNLVATPKHDAVRSGPRPGEIWTTRREGEARLTMGFECSKASKSEANYVQWRAFVHRGDNILPSLYRHRWGLLEFNGGGPSQE